MIAQVPTRSMIIVSPCSMLGGGSESAHKYELLVTKLEAFKYPKISLARALIFTSATQRSLEPRLICDFVG